MPQKVRGSPLSPPQIPSIPHHSEPTPQGPLHCLAKRQKQKMFLSKLAPRMTMKNRSEFTRQLLMDPGGSARNCIVYFTSNFLLLNQRCTLPRSVIHLGLCGLCPCVSLHEENTTQAGLSVILAHQVQSTGVGCMRKYLNTSLEGRSFVFLLSLSPSNLASLSCSHCNTGTIGRDNGSLRN